MVIMLQINHMWMVLNKQQLRYLYLYTFLNYEMGQCIEEVTKFLKSRSKYGISNDLDFTA